MALNTKKKIIARNAPAGIVMTQETKIRLTTRRSIASMPRAIPTPSTAPTRVCVVEIGIPVPEAITMVVAAASSAANPRLGVNWVIRYGARRRSE